MNTVAHEEDAPGRARPMSTLCPITCVFLFLFGLCCCFFYGMHVGSKVSSVHVANEMESSCRDRLILAARGGADGVACDPMSASSVYRDDRTLWLHCRCQLRDRAAAGESSPPAPQDQDKGQSE